MGAILRTSDYYTLLGVVRSPVLDPEALKRSYKRLALICHPDKSAHPEAEVAFKKVHRAFTVLSQKDLRNVYDTFGESSRGGADVQEESVIEEAKHMFPGMDIPSAIAVLRVIVGASGGKCGYDVDQIADLLRGTRERTKSKKIWSIVVVAAIFCLKISIG